MALLSWLRYLSSLYVGVLSIDKVLSGCRVKWTVSKSSVGIVFRAGKQKMVLSC